MAIGDGKQKGYNQRLQVGDGGQLVVTDNRLSISGSAVSGPAGNFEEVEVGMRVDIEGFAQGDFEAYVSGIDTIDFAEITLTYIYGSTGEELTLEDESEGRAITLTFQKFYPISEEQSLSFSNSPTTEEATSKERKGQVTQDVISYGTSFDCSGKADFPDTNGLARVKNAVINVEPVVCRIIENNLGDVWEGPFVITHNQSSEPSQNIGYSISGESAGLVKFMVI